MEPGINALVVDDSAVIRKIMVGALATAGVEDVDQATDGEQALEAVSRKPYALIMMDWNMPNMTGIEAVRAIRSRGLDVPIVMVTTESDRSRVLEAIKAGVNDYVMKPFTADIIARTVQKVLARRAPFGAPIQESE